MTNNELFDKLFQRHDETDKKLDDMCEKIHELIRAQREFAQRLEKIETENGFFILHRLNFRTPTPTNY